MPYLLILVLLLGGCAGGGFGSNQADVIKAMQGDTATVCFSANYAGASVKLNRTNIVNGDVLCNDNGMTIKSVAPQLQVPATVTIQNPVSVTPPK